MKHQQSFLVFGATGQTGNHFISIALENGCKVRALVRNPAKVTQKHTNLEIHQGSITDELNLDDLLQGIDSVVNMVGDVELQKYMPINTLFTKNLIPAMRRQGVKKLLYQAGGFSRRPDQRFALVPWFARNTFARRLDGQHKDNEAVMKYLVQNAGDIEWVVHRAAIGSDGPTKGNLGRSKLFPSVATFIDCAEYNHRLINDSNAIHTCDLSRYQKS
jgi:putative NADH-flavin reductase